MQQQHRHAAQQQAIEQGLALAGGQHHGSVESNVGAQLVVRDHAQVNIQRFGALRQGQQVVTAGHRFAVGGQCRAGVDFADQFLIIEYIHVQARQVRGKQPQDLLVLVGLQAYAQPQGFAGFSSTNAVKVDRAELAGQARGAYIAQLQAGLRV